eukprot:scaffold818_cov136-Cylindrotheca_fusiformis.AAC.54
MLIRSLICISGIFFIGQTRRHVIVPGCEAFSPAHFPPTRTSSMISSSTVAVPKSSNENEVLAATLDSAKQIISEAISIGTPAYNAGNISECSRAYQDAAKEVAFLVPANLNKKLHKAKEIDENNHDAKAWALRRALHAIMDYDLPVLPQALDDGEVGFEPFTKAQLPQEPVAVMDNVMGGVSQGGWIGKSRIFYGSTSLENNGGFASIRWRFPTTQNWSHAQGIYLKGVRHSKPEEHTFRIVLKDDACQKARLANFNVVFANPQETERNVFIPFSEFNQMEQMGKPLARSPVFNPLAVTEIGLMAIKPTIVGEFQLEFSEWGLYM